MLAGCLSTTGDGWACCCAASSMCNTPDKSPAHGGGGWGIMGGQTPSEEGGEEEVGAEQGRRGGGTSRGRWREIGEGLLREKRGGVDGRGLSLRGHLYAGLVETRLEKRPEHVTAGIKDT